MRQLLLRRELGVKAELAVFKSVFVPILTYGHEPWVMTERTRSRATEMAFLRRISGLTMLDRVRSSEIRVEPLLLQIERSQLRYYGHVMRMSSDRIENMVLKTHPTGRRPRGRPRMRLSDYIRDLVQSRLGISPYVLPEAASERGHWTELLRTLPPQSLQGLSGLEDDDL
ncbi:Uncharacterised protein r2_g1203 [Pycnogonum litorale]